MSLHTLTDILLLHHGLGEGLCLGSEWSFYGLSERRVVLDPAEARFFRTEKNALVLLTMLKGPLLLFQVQMDYSFSTTVLNWKKCV